MALAVGPGWSQSDAPAVRRTSIELVASEDDPTSPAFSIAPATPRVRHRLQGLDTHWTEPTEQMSFIVRFIGSTDGPIQHLFFPVKGRSEGWTGELASSPYFNRTEELIIPDGTSMVQIAFSSSGPPQAVGVFGIQNLKVSQIDGDNETTLMVNGSIPGDAPSSWNKSGTLPAMAIDEADAPSRLKLIDNDLTRHADWASPTLRVNGKLLRVEWQEAHSIGLGGPRTIEYDRLPPGRYQFQVEELTIGGIPTGQITMLDLVIPQPLWARWSFWLPATVALTSLAYLIIRPAMQHKVKRAIRHNRLIEEERLRIAMDLHDDIGTQLSQISLLSSHSLMKASDDITRDSLEQIKNLAGRLADSLSQTVWMLSPKNNDLESMTGFLCRLTSDLCRAGGFRCRIDAEAFDDIIPVTQEFRHHVVLSVKEALNNALKHSQGTEIRLKVSLKDRQLTVVVSDNGKAYSEPLNQQGNGLDSMKRRLRELNGTLTIETPRDGGLRVVMSAPIKHDTLQIA